MISVKLEISEKLKFSMADASYGYLSMEETSGSIALLSILSHLVIHSLTISIV